MTRPARQIEIVTALMAIFLAGGVAHTQPGGDLRVASIIRLGPIMSEIGTEDGRGPTVFGVVRGAQLDSAGNIFVLDVADKVVRRFDAHGRFVAGTGIPGSGPGELSAPHTIVHDGRALLYVLDRQNGLNVFETAGGRLRFRTRLFAVERPDGLCIMGDRLVTQFYRSGKNLHLLRPDGSVERSFGDHELRDTTEVSRLVSSANGRMRLACDARSNVVYAAQMNDSTVTAYDVATGRPLWSTALPQYRGANTRFSGRGFSMSTGAMHTVSVRLWSDSLLLVQAQDQARLMRVAGRSLQTDIQDRGVMSYVLNAATGRVIASGYWGPFIGDSKGNEVVAFTDDPFPKVLRLAIRPR